MGANKLEEEIVISFEKHRQIVYACVLGDISLKNGAIFCNALGIERVNKFKNDGVHFKVVNKNKLIHAMIKYNFTL